MLATKAGGEQRQKWANKLALVGLLLAATTWSTAQSPGAAPAAKKATVAKPTASQTTAANPKTAATPAAIPAAAAEAARSGKGWKVGPIPAWVVAAPAAPAGVTPTPNVGARREQLIDIQLSHTNPKPQYFVRIRSLALDATVLGSVSQPQITFNPAFQTVWVHGVVVVRDGQRSDRLAQARIEPMRREQRLEQQIIDGNDTLLVVLNDVRVGDAVEVAYTVEGENPIFEGRISWGMRLAYDTPVDVLHQRVLAPASRTLRTKGLATDAEPERLTEGANQVLRAVRYQVPALVQEQNTPPWFKVFPAIDVSEYASWAEVDAWAQRLFALPSPAAPEVMAQAAKFRELAKDKNLPQEALLSEVLRFVQDEVRYFSVSLGESSHRPKPPQQTLAERLGDCKDKTNLLNALLRELGFDAKPALVSVQRNKGITDYLPTHDIFDHVISRIDLNGKVWWLDSTISKQGLNLDSRGQVPYGAAFVVGSGAAAASVAPQRVAESPATADRIEFEQIWDLSQPGQPAKLTTVLRARGLQAEGWRSSAGGAGAEAVSKALSGSFARMLPGLKTSGEAEIVDDRSTNQFELRQRFELAEFGTYNRGAIDTEYLAVDMLDVLSGPADTQRRTPFFVNQPRLAESRITVTGPAAFAFPAPAPIEVVHKQFRYSVRMEVQGNKASFLRRYERREDEVSAAELTAWREKVLQARQTTSGRLRLPLLNSEALMTELQGVDRRLRGARGWRNDALQNTLARNEFGRVIDTRALARVPASSAVATKALVSRAQANNLLGDFASGQNDANLALTNAPGDAEALDASAVALLGLGKAEDALATFARINPQSRSAATAQWMGSVQLHMGRPAEAETLLRDAITNGAGEGREWALVWLYLAAERQGGRGVAAVAEHLSGSDTKRLPGAVLSFMVGKLSREDLLKQAAANPQMERLNLAEAQFYIGQKLLAQGKAGEAQSWFQRTVDTQATPYREVTFAKLELARAGR